MFGVSLATGIAQALGVILLMVHLFGARANFDYRLWRVRWSFYGVNSIFKTGAPSFLSEASFSVALLFMNRVVGSLQEKRGLLPWASCLRSLSLSTM
jgi:Na+-driven multidrug efflux pump